MVGIVKISIGKPGIIYYHDELHTWKGLAQREVEVACA